MSMNKFMHPRNPYRNPPDFKKLAVDYPEFRKYVNQDLSGKVKLNFKDEGAVWSLTKSLLHKDFGLHVEIVEGRLVPTLPLRMNYLLWLEDLIRMYKTMDQSIFGIDIGSGACCIYPLIASKYFNWHMVASEVDPENYECAVNNIKRNNLEEYVTAKKVVEETYLCGVIDENSQFDFCMCNPPFFGDNREPKRRNEGRSEPRNAPSGADVELVTDGGEVSFVKAIIDDSKKLKCAIRIYTVMLGCKSSLSPLKEYIKTQNAASLGTSMFCQGRTTRWGLAWTYDDSIDLAAASKTNNKNKKLEVSYKHIVPLVENMNFDIVIKKLVEFLKEHELTVEENLKSVGIHIMTLKARSNTWTKSRRRRREDKRKSSTSTSHEGDSSTSDSTQCSEAQNVVKSTTNTLKRSSNGNYEPKEKKLKTDSDNANEYLLIALLTVKKLDTNLEFEIKYLDGNGNKDNAHQLLQCLRNLLK